MACLVMIGIAVQAFYSGVFDGAEATTQLIMSLTVVLIVNIYFGFDFIFR